MTDTVHQRLESLSTQLDGLETAAQELERSPDDPDLGVSVRRIARSLQRAADQLELAEVAAGAQAIQRAADAHLGRSVANFLERIGEIRAASPSETSTVLVVEDNRTVAAATRAYLEGVGHEVMVAPTATQALETLAAPDTHEIDVVILDLILPDRDGRDVLVQMREQRSTATLPVIVLSSRGGGVARAECLAVGADEFMEKPAEPAALCAAVARQIRTGRRRRDALRDGLTGLPNRAGISTEFEERRHACRETGETLSVAILALDSLGEITMKLGRDAGDRFLLEVSSALHDAMGKGDRLGRWETAELVAILPETAARDAKAFLNDTLAHLTSDGTFDEVEEAGIEVRLSGGVTEVDSDEDLPDVLASAERSLYSARAGEGDPVRSEADPLEFELRRILLVEDEPVTATLIRHRLIRDGHDVVHFPDGADAFRWAEAEDFDLAILDVKVPGMDGFELLARLRDIPRYADVPVVMLTGMGSESDVIRGLELGADDYMLKPFSPSELLARARRLLHGRERAPGPPPSSTTDPPPGQEARG